MAWPEPMAWELLLEANHRTKPNTDPQINSVLIALVSLKTGLLSRGERAG